MPLHVDNPDYSQVPRPPTNGQHRPIWANWGFYQQPVPYAYEVHNLEHGGVVVHLGLRISRAAGTQVVRLWADSPPYMLVVPGLPADVPQRGVTRHELAARDDLQDLERAHADRDPHLPRRLPRHRPRADPVAQLAARAPTTCRRRRCPTRRA